MNGNVRSLVVTVCVRKIKGNKTWQKSERSRNETFERLPSSKMMRKTNEWKEKIFLRRVMFVWNGISLPFQMKRRKKKVGNEGREYENIVSVFFVDDLPHTFRIYQCIIKNWRRHKNDVFFSFIFRKVGVKSNAETSKILLFFLK